MCDRDCELFYLQSALVGAPKDPALNRLYAITLTDRGLIDQAFVFWHRVEEILPSDEDGKTSRRRVDGPKSAFEGGV